MTLDFQVKFWKATEIHGIPRTESGLYDVCKWEGKKRKKREA